LISCLIHIWNAIGAAGTNVRYTTRSDFVRRLLSDTDKRTRKILQNPDNHVILIDYSEYSDSNLFDCEILHNICVHIHQNIAPIIVFDGNVDHIPIKQKCTFIKMDVNNSLPDNNLDIFKILA